MFVKFCKSYPITPKVFFKNAVNNIVSYKGFIVFEKFSIKISDFSGIFRAIAEKSNINGGETLEGEEISLFCNIKQTIDKNKSIFTFEGKQYDKNGNEYSPYLLKTPGNFDYKDFREYSQTIKTNDNAIKLADKYVELHKRTVKRLASSWSNTYRIKDKDFEKFIEQVYRTARLLNITKTNKGETRETFVPSEKYPDFEDKIVDEICASFASESRLDTKAVSDDKLYYGLFQFSQIGLNDIKQNRKLLKLDGIYLKPINKITEFTNLTRIEQLNYMIAYVKNCEKFYSKIEGAQISPKQMYSMWHLPAAANDSSNNASKQAKINAKMRERDKIFPLL